MYVQDSDEYVLSSMTTKSCTYTTLYREMADPASEEPVATDQELTDPDEYVFIPSC